jgi:hypothetical protein
MKQIQSPEDDAQICQSFMGNQNDDSDKIKQHWAFNLPCVLFVNRSESNWQRLKPIYVKLYRDVLLSVRKTLAASMSQVVKLVNMKDPDNQIFFLEVINHFLEDIDDIKQRILPQICEFVSLYP